MRRVLSLSAFAAVVAMTGAAQAAPVVIGDFVEVASVNKYGNNMGFSGSNFVGRNESGRNWGDSIGNNFNTESITLDRNLAASTLTITFKTDFGGTSAGADYADIFIDTTTPEAPDGFNYAISLGDQTGGSGHGNNGGLIAGVYEVGSLKTSNDIWGSSSSTYGGYLNFEPGTPGRDPDFEAPVATVLTGGLDLGMSVTVTRLAASGGGYNLQVVIDGSSNVGDFNTIFDNFDILWGTGDCSNDAIWGMVEFTSTEVPVPGAALLLGFGLLGVVGMRRKAA